MPSPARPMPRRPVVALLAACAVTAAACGHRVGTDELVAANSQVVDGALVGGGQVTADGSATIAESATDGATGAISPGPAVGTGSTSDGSPRGDSPVGSAVGTPGQTGPIVIGSVGNYSGIAGPPQAPMARAVQTWAEYVNSEGGLFGRQVQVIVVDDRGDPAQHLAALRNLVDRGVVAFVSNGAALTVASGREYLESAGVPVIGTGCATTTEFESVIFFPQCQRFSEFFTSLLAVGVNTSGVDPALAVVSCTEAPTCAEGRRYMLGPGRAIERSGARLVYQAQVSVAQPDFTSECRQAQQAGATMVHVLLDQTGVIRFARSCARQGYNPIYLQGSATVFYDSKDQPGLSNLITSSQVFNFAGTETPARQQFQDVMATFLGSPPGPAEAYGWAAAKLFELAAFRAAEVSQSLTPGTLVDALHTFQGETLDGLTVPLTFPKNRPAQPASCAFAVQVRDGEWTPLNGGDMFCL